MMQLSSNTDIKNKVDAIESIVNIRYAPLRPIRLLMNERIILDLQNALLGIRQNLEVATEFSDENQRSVELGNLQRYIDYVDVKNRMNSHNFLLFSVTLSMALAFMSLAISIF